MPSPSRLDDLRRLRRSLDLVADMISRKNLRDISIDYSQNGDPVTSLDREINQLLRTSLPVDGEGWLSEESSDDLTRLHHSRVWVVDPIDGTREFVEGIPEWCVSVALVEDHEAVAGGILNPLTGEMYLGSIETGLEIVCLLESRPRNKDRGSCVLVSRREHREGKWAKFERTDLAILPVGSIAYRLALVAAGFADATCTFERRHEWDIAAGVALVLASGGTVQTADGLPVRFNNANPSLPTLFVSGKTCASGLQEALIPG